MPVLEWNINFLTGIREIDQDHRHLVDLLNESYEALKGGAAADQMQSVVDELVRYADYHFSCEEQLMVAASYPDYAEHKKEHEIFTDRATEFQNCFENGEVPAIAILSFLSNWITHHFLKTDVKFGAFVDSRNLLKTIPRQPNPQGSRNA